MRRRNRILIGSGSATLAAVLTPVGVFLVERQRWTALIAVACVQLIALGVAITFLSLAQRAD